MQGTPAARHGVLALVCVLAAACATQAPPAPALVPVPANWSLAPGGGDGPSPRWWRGFGDALLAQLVEDAQEANTDVRIAQATLQRARALRDEAAAARRPTLALSASVQRQGAGGTPSTRSIGTGLDASLRVDAFGELGHGIAAADAETRASAATLDATRLAIAVEVATSYLQLRGGQARAAIARENLAGQQQTLQIARWREQAGLGSSLDVAQARSAVEQTRAQIPLLDAGIERNAHALAVLTGQVPAALQSRLALPATLPQPPADTTPAIPARTLRQRADVRAAEYRMLAQAERVAAADAARRPSLQLRASLAWSALTLGSLGSTGAARSLLASAGLPLVDGGRLGAELAAQQAEFDAAQQRYRASVLAALQQVEDALATLAAARARVAALRAATEAARNAALLATQRYASGVVDFQTVLETQRVLLNVQDGTAGAETELALDHVQLIQALGGGWSEP